MEEVSRRPRTRSMQCSSMQVPTEPQGGSVAPATGIVIRELDANVPLRDVLEASYVGKGKGIMEEVSTRPTTRSMVSSSMQVPTVESNHAMKPEYGGQRTPCTFLSYYFGARIVIVVDHYSSFSSKECLRDRHISLEVFLVNLADQDNAKTLYFDRTPREESELKLESLARGKDQKHSEFGFGHRKMILKIQH
ncbi:hypothetical protein Cgig2_003369 [Carnegiea gigantea]|uniref:Uncharacterized protein n=1 Tax=Carnegiea gigantea TaxID=171969 RepID=A0A9Q1JIX1_9CARY|nr:hypothetical protein Cgig2_003369 [Carnegiea gigantea]